jgi:hypothetical protein
MPNTDDVAVANEYGCLTVSDVIAIQMSRFCNYKQLIGIDIDLGKLVALIGILDGERVQIVRLL